MRTGLKNLLSSLFVLAGLIWFFIRPVSQAILWIAGLFGAREDLEKLRDFLVEMEVHAYGPWILVILGAVSLAWINFKDEIKGLFKKSASKEELAQMCDELSRDITEFMYERATTAPPHFPENEEKLREASYEQFRRKADYSNQTSNLYGRRFNTRLNVLCSQLRENGHRPDSLLTHGQDAWSDRKAGMLADYARILREGGKILPSDRNN